MLRTHSNFLLAAAALAGLALSSNPATAQTEQLHVEAVIGDICTVTAASLDFGSEYDATGAVNATGSIDISCIAPTSLDVALNGGQQGAAGGQRTMKNGADSLLYVLYTNGHSGDPWETDEAVPATVTGSGSVPVYGTIPLQGNDHDPGVYTDDVTITLSF